MIDSDLYDYTPPPTEGQWVRDGLVWRWSGPPIDPPEVDHAGRFAPKPQPACGTEKGYQWHRARQLPEWPLPETDECGCRAAHRDHQRRMADQRREQRRRKAARCEAA